jgi:hypothetical protein
MATGALNAQGVWIYGEDDSETTFSALLNKLGNSVSSNLKGKIVQSLQYSTTTTVFQSSATYATTGLTGTITPTSASSKILVLVAQNGLSKEQADTYGRLRLVRTLSGVTTTLSEFEKSFARLIGSSALLGVGGTNLSYLDTPNTTSSITYRTEVQNANAAGFVSVQNQGSQSTLILIEVSA